MQGRRPGRLGLGGHVKLQLTVPWTAACPVTTSPPQRCGCSVPTWRRPLPRASLLSSSLALGQILLAPLPGGRQEDREQEEGTFVQAPSSNHPSGQGQAEGPVRGPLLSSFPAP